MVRKPRPELRLIYSSTAARDLSTEDLDDIAERSLINNANFGLTGLLLYRSGTFQAVLEGSETLVLERMEVIITDKRHRDISIFQEQTITRRRFANWSFAQLPNLPTGKVDVMAAFGKTLFDRLM